MLYEVPIRCPCKVNGLQRHSGRRYEFEDRRGKLQDYLRRNYPRPEPLTVPCLMHVALYLKDNSRGDLFNYLDGVADSVSVGKVANRRLATAMHLFPILSDDSLVYGIAPLAGLDRCLFLGEDRIVFEFIPLSPLL